MKSQTIIRSLHHVSLSIKLSFRFYSMAATVYSVMGGSPRHSKNLISFSLSSSSSILQSLMKTCSSFESLMVLSWGISAASYSSAVSTSFDFRIFSSRLSMNYESRPKGRYRELRSREKGITIYVVSSIYSLDNISTIREFENQFFEDVEEYFIC